MGAAAVMTAIVAAAQWHEMNTSGVDTKNLATAATAQAKSMGQLVTASRDQATATANLKQAAIDQATAARIQAVAMDKLRQAGEAQARSMDQLRGAGEAQARSSASLAAAGKAQAESTKTLAREYGNQLAAIQETAGAAEVSARAATDSAARTLNSERARFYETSVVFKTNGDNDPNPTVQFGFMNLGRTPALVKEVFSKCEVVGDTFPTNPNFDGGWAQGAQNAIAPGAVMDTENEPVKLSRCKFRRPLTPSDYAGLKAGRLHILVTLYVKFIDIYGTSYKRVVGGLTFEDMIFRTISLPGYNAEIKERGP